MAVIFLLFLNALSLIDKDIYFEKMPEQSLFVILPSSTDEDTLYKSFSERIKNLMNMLLKL